MLLQGSQLQDTPFVVPILYLWFIQTGSTSTITLSDTTGTGGARSAARGRTVASQFIAQGNTTAVLSADVQSIFDLRQNSGRPSPSRERERCSGNEGQGL